MLKPGTLLKTHSDFEATMQTKQSVIVFQDHRVLDAGGLIERHDLFTVVINAMHYVKTACVFKIR